MAKVVGVGGVFFRSQDVKVLRGWYERVLGMEMEAWGGVLFPPLPKGKTVWAPFPAETDYFAPGTGEFMLNLVVDDLDAVVARAKAEGVEAFGAMEDENGRFAYVVDPEKRKVELWEPKAAE